MWLVTRRGVIVADGLFHGRESVLQAVEVP